MFKGKKLAFLLFPVATLLIFLFIYASSPNLNPIYADGAFFWAFVITLYLVLIYIARFSKQWFSQQKVINANGRFSFSYKNKFSRKYLAVIAVPWVLFFLAGILSTPLFHVERYKNQLSAPPESSFSSEIQTIDTSQIPIVDMEMAANLADKKLGEEASLGSQVTLGEPTIQQVKGKLVWVVPLYHSGLFKWLANMDGSKGYIVISATNAMDVTYVKDYKIKIQPNAYFNDSLYRKSRFSGGLFKGITDYSFELDDEGNPYWVVTTYYNKALFSLPEADGVILINAVTGKSDRYSMSSIPQWVDRVQPEDFVMNQINNRGEYINGLFNFSNKGKFQTSQGDIIIYNNGRCYLLTGITSVGADESAMGFMMVDMVTKQPFYYKMSGATEYVAQQSAEGAVQDLKYNASFPIILNISGKPTYFMTLKDNAGLIKMYAFVSVEHYSVVGIGSTINDAKQNYESALSGSGSLADEGETSESITGTVFRISGEVSGSKMVYKVVLTEKPDKIFSIPADKSAELSLTQPGDSVTIVYHPLASKGVLTVLSFDNQALQITE